VGADAIARDPSATLPAALRRGDRAGGRFYDGRRFVGRWGLDPAAAGVTLAFVPEPGPPPVADADPERIRQVLTNLIGNALRYTPRVGAVRIRCGGAGHDRIAVTVEDTGSGIAAADLPHVFERFYESKDSRGSGLGPAIVKRIVQAHGGEISAESEPGRGTSIRIVLPRQAAG
jgi:signal transduction histidine kinase